MAIEIRTNGRRSTTTGFVHVDGEYIGAVFPEFSTWSGETYSGGVVRKTQGHPTPMDAAKALVELVA